MTQLDRFRELIDLLNEQADLKEERAVQMRKELDDRYSQERGEISDIHVRVSMIRDHVRKLESMMEDSPGDVAQMVSFFMDKERKVILL